MIAECHCEIKLYEAKTGHMIELLRAEECDLKSIL